MLPARGKIFAQEEGWDYCTFVNETTYMSILTLKYRLQEKITDEECGLGETEIY